MSRGNASTAQFLSIGLEVYVVFACGILAVAIATARDVVLLLASAKYAGADYLIPWLLGGLLIYAAHIFVVAGLMIHKQTMKMARLLAIAAGCNIALNCVLLPVFGLIGGGFATLLSYALCIFLLALASRPYLALTLRLRSLAVYLSAGMAACLTAMLFSFDSVIADIVARSTTVIAVYFGILYTVDARVRQVVYLGRQVTARYL
jgi:O-antigen/teichoic acid export membrane protein